MRKDGSPSRLPDALAAGRRELALYVAAGTTYVAIGVAFPEFLFTWVVAVGYLLVFVVVVPTLVARIRRRPETGA